MKTRILLISLLIMLIISLSLVACSKKTPDSIEKSSEVVSIDSIYLTFDEALIICEEWLNNHKTLSSYSILNREYEPDPAPPTTYDLFEEPYYKFLVYHQLNGDSEDAQYILVHPETRELLSLFITTSDNSGNIYTVEKLDDWYNGDNDAHLQASITAKEALDIYDEWLYKRSSNIDDVYLYFLNEGVHDKYIIFGEEYYYFHANEMHMYWYNILVHTKTGEMLFFMNSDGLYPEQHILPLDDWYDSLSVG